MTKLTVNGVERQFDVEPDTPLLWVIRDTLGLDGDEIRLRHRRLRRLHGAGRRRRRALVFGRWPPISTAHPSPPSKGSRPIAAIPLQQAWIAEQVPQCGYCQSGMILAAAALLKANRQAERRRHRRRDHQHLPLRNLSAGARGDPPGGGGDAMSRFRVSRRALLIGGGALGLLVGVGAWRLTRKRASLAGTVDADGAFLHDWIHVGRDGVVTVRTGLSEMGQGAFTGVATLVAEELGCRLEAMRVETGPASDAFKNIAVGRDILAPNHGLAKGEPSGLTGAVIDFVAEAATEQITGGSSTIVDRFTRARAAGAAARAMLVQAAARRWGVAPEQCAVRDGAVIHAASKRSQDFGDLALDAAKETPPARIALKPRAQWTLIGAQSDPARRHSRKSRRLGEIRRRRAPAGHGLRGDRPLSRRSAER